MAVISLQADYLALIEELRIGLVSKVTFERNQVVCRPHKPTLVGPIETAPVYDFSRLIHAPALDVSVAQALVRPIVERGQLRMPYPTTVFLYEHVKPSPMSCDWRVAHLAHQAEDGSLQVQTFLRLLNREKKWDRWAAENMKMRWQPEKDIQFSGVASGFTGEMWEKLEIEYWGRCWLLVYHIDQLMTQPEGRMTRPDYDLPDVKRIMQRREKLHLPPVPRIRHISLTPPEPRELRGHGGVGGGKPRQPAQVQGFWRRNPVNPGHHWVPPFVRPKPKDGEAPPVPWYKVDS